jgi:PAS domain S-box-containing protein
VAQSHVRRRITLALLTVAYIAAGRFGLSLAFVNASASAVWPPTGVAIGALLVLGSEVWPAIALGALVVNLWNSGDVASSMAIAAGNTLEALAAAWLTRRLARGRAAFDSTAHVVRFVGIAAVASAIAASIGVGALLATGLAASSDAVSVWFTWWLGDAVGAIVVAPMIVLWDRRPALPEIVRRAPELGALTATLTFVSFGVFSPWPADGPDYPFVIVPVLLWSAFRFGAWITALGSALVVVIAVNGTLQGFGPFGRSPMNDALLLVQGFVGITATMMLSAAAEVARRRAVERDLRLLNEDLEQTITDRTDELLKANDRLLEAQEVAHVGSWEWDIAADRVWWSDEMYRIYRMDRSAPIGYDTVLSRVHPDDRALMDSTVRQAMHDGRAFGFDHRIVRDDGSVRVLHAAGRVILDGSSRLVRMVGTAHDITGRKEAEESRAQLIQEQAARHEAEEMSRAKDQFLAILSHELRTPLNAALGWAQMLRTMPRDAPATRNAVDTIYRNLLIQARLVSDIVDVSRIAKGALILERAPIDLLAIINSAMDMVREQAHARDIRLESHIDCGMVALDGDAKRLEQVFWNLLSNGVRFGRDGGMVRVAATATADSVWVTVEDDGPGIDPAFLPHIFEPFRQADASPGRAHDGLGLGLAIAWHLVELHGGSMAAANRPDGGARLTVVLPAKSALATA